jgi:hypothetical protein
MWDGLQELSKLILELQHRNISPHQADVKVGVLDKILEDGRP